MMLPNFQLFLKYCDKNYSWNDLTQKILQIIVNVSKHLTFLSMYVHLGESFFSRENHSPILFSPILYAISMCLGENIPQNILLVHLEDKIPLNVLLLMSTFRGIFPLNVIFV